MNRVIRHAQLSDAVDYFGGGEPQFVDEHVAALVEQARSDGFAAGWQEGHDAGRHEVAAIVGRLDASLRDAVREMRVAHHAAVHATVDAALSVAEFVIGHAPHDGGAVMAGRIREALEALDDESIVVSVAAADWDLVSEALDLPPGVTLDRDAHLQPGEAKVRGKWSAVDMTRRAALAVVEEALS